MLCSLLLGFGLDAYVCVGTSGDGPHIWVVSRVERKSKKGQNDNQFEVTFWESLTGQKYPQSNFNIYKFQCSFLILDDPKVNYLYRKIGCVFNHKSFYGNLQQNDSAFYTSFDLEDEYLWKAMDPKMIKSISKASNLQTLMPSTLNKHRIEEEVEDVL